MAGGEGVKKSDLPTRVASAVVMVAVAGAALWLGGWLWVAFVTAIAVGVLWEWKSLAFAMTSAPAGRLAWALGALLYVGVAAWVLIALGESSAELTLYPIGAVVATDVGAYFVGRSVGGPKIAARISPSKTWAGLFGGIVFASAWIFGYSWILFRDTPIVSFDGRVALIPSVAYGSLAAVAAQFGDFFESWMKRRAGVKDSGRVIPGHGGLFDRADGLLAVLFVLGLLWAANQLVEA